tara:strand:- start:647 stop:946 length:300 start_codon:yes stop_codon:yes gene_type:complete
MKRLNRRGLQKLLLKEFKMMGMAPMGAVGDAPLGMPGHGSDYGMEEDYLAPAEDYNQHSAGTISKEDCCTAILSLIECCECPETKQLLRECCEDILSRC